MLQHFFTFYSKLTFRDIQENVVCPYTGRMMPRSHFDNPDTLPEEFGNYKDQVMLNSNSYRIVCNSTLCLQDPVEQSDNLSKFITDSVVLGFLESCVLTAQMMKGLLYPGMHRSNPYPADAFKWNDLPVGFFTSSYTQQKPPR